MIMISSKSVLRSIEELIGNRDIPLPSNESMVGKEGVTIFKVAQTKVLLPTFQDIKLSTKRDVTLSRILDYVKRGW